MLLRTAKNVLMVLLLHLIKLPELKVRIARHVHKVRYAITIKQGRCFLLFLMKSLRLLSFIAV